MVIHEFQASRCYVGMARTPASSYTFSKSPNSQNTHTAQHLPVVDMKYYTLPPDQMEPLVRDKSVNDRASTPSERNFLLVKAITISLGIPGSQQNLVRQAISRPFIHSDNDYFLEIVNLKQLHIFCGRHDVVITRSYEEFLVHQATVGLTTKHRPSLVFSGDDMDYSRVYFFMPKYVRTCMHACSGTPPNRTPLKIVLNSDQGVLLTSGGCKCVIWD